ncbi:MAG: hypothetical protein AB7O49_06545 [Sphingomonadales bacterium]
MFAQMDSQALAAVGPLESDGVFARLVGLANAGNPQAKARVGLHLFLRANASSGDYGPSLKYIYSALEKPDDIDKKLKGQLYYALGVIYEDFRTNIADINRSIQYLLIFIRDYSQNSPYQMVNSARLKMIRSYIAGGPQFPRNFRLVIVYAEQILNDRELSDSGVGRLTRDAAHIALGVAFYYGYDGVGVNLTKAKDNLTKAMNSSNPAFKNLAESMIASIDQGT